MFFIYIHPQLIRPKQLSNIYVCTSRTLLARTHLILFKINVPCDPYFNHNKCELIYTRIISGQRDANADYYLYSSKYARTTYIKQIVSWNFRPIFTLIYHTNKCIKCIYNTRTHVICWWENQPFFFADITINRWFCFFFHEK